MNVFRKPTPEETLRQGQRQIRTANRALATDSRQIERKEKELEAEIKRLAKAGQKEACKPLAKQLVQLRRHRQMNVAVNTAITSAGVKNRQMHSVGVVAQAMGEATSAMAAVDARMPLANVAQNARKFVRANALADARSELIDETLDSMLDDGEDNEEAERAVIDRVLDEIGIDTNAKLPNVPPNRSTAHSDASKSKDAQNAEIERLLTELNK